MERYTCILFAVFMCIHCVHVSAILVLYQPSTCSQNYLHSCQTHELSLTVCYGVNVYKWCEFFQLGCAGKLQNISTISAHVNQSCQAILVIRAPPSTTHRPTTTHRPSTHFEQNFFSAAVHGIDDLLQKANGTGSTVDQMRKIFSVQDHNHKHYIRNPHCWAYPLDLTSISPWNSNGHTRKAGTLITPRHVVWARHYSMPVNTTIRFIDHNNNVVDRKITKTRAVPVNGSNYHSGADIVVAELDSDVTSAISFAKVMPKHLSTIRPFSNMRIPAFDTDFEEKALVADLRYESGRMAGLSLPSDSLRHQFYEPKIVGDSGNPVFLVIDKELVLMFMFTYGGAGSGTSITSHYDDINHIIKAWGSSYMLTDIDLTQYLDAGSQIPQIIG